MRGGLVVHAQQVVLGQHPVGLTRGLVRTGDQGHGVAHDETDEAGQERIVGAAQHHRVDLGLLEWLQIGLCQAQQLRTGGDAALHVVDESRAGDAGHAHVRCGGERVNVGTTGHGRHGADHADPAGAGRRYGATHGWPDHLDHGHRVALARVVQAGRRGAVAGDDEHLHAVVDEPVEALERVGPHLCDRLRAVGQVRRVAEIADLLVRQLVENRPGDGETTDPRIEYPHRRACHGREPTLTHPPAMNTQGQLVANVTWVGGVQDATN